MGKIVRLYEKFTHFLDYLRNPLLLVIRLYWGWQFFLTGKGKLMNLDDTAKFFTELHIPMPKLNAAMAGSVECFGGLLLFLGLGSRLASIPLTVTMLVALATAHHDQLVNIFQNPDDVLQADPFLFLLASLIVMTCGPGWFSIDALIKRFLKKSHPEMLSNPSGMEVSRT